MTSNNLQVAELPEGFEPGSVKRAVKCSTTLATIQTKALSFSLSEKKLSNIARSSLNGQLSTKKEAAKARKLLSS